jgi:hypothetical protein
MLRARFVVALALVVVGVGVALGVRALVDAHASSARSARRARAERAYATATTALAARGLPRGVLPGAGAQQTCAATVCGHSRLTPQQLAPALRAFVGPALTIHGRRPPLPAGCLRPPGAHTSFCAATATGRFHGYPIFATAFWIVVVVRHGPGPAGARLYDRTHSGRIYLNGSTVAITLATPSALSAS